MRRTPAHFAKASTDQMIFAFTYSICPVAGIPTLKIITTTDNHYTTEPFQTN
jgi:hypothetical protein